MRGNACFDLYSVYIWSQNVHHWSIFQAYLDILIYTQSTFQIKCTSLIYIFKAYNIKIYIISLYFKPISLVYISSICHQSSFQIYNIKNIYKSNKIKTPSIFQNKCQKWILCLIFTNYLQGNRHGYTYLEYNSLFCECFVL